jgi:predicted nuclease with TOPRIM domain
MYLTRAIRDITRRLDEMTTATKELFAKNAQLENDLTVANGQIEHTAKIKIKIMGCLGYGPTAINNLSFNLNDLVARLIKLIEGFREDTSSADTEIDRLRATNREHAAQIDRLAKGFKSVNELCDELNIRKDGVSTPERVNILRSWFESNSRRSEYLEVKSSKLNSEKRKLMELMLNHSKVTAWKMYDKWLKQQAKKRRKKCES